MNAVKVYNATCLVLEGDFTVFAVYLAIVAYPLFSLVPVLAWLTGFLVLAALLFWYEA